MPLYMEQLLAKLKEFEGSIPWMYRDTAGYVTVAIGLMLPDADAAVKLPFLLDGKPVSAEAIRAEFARVHALPMGRPALFYRGKHQPELAQTEVDALLQKVVEGFEGQLRAAIHQYDALPDGVRVALLDMAYNLGPPGLLHGYPKLMKAVAAGDWTQAAANCERRGPGATRNAWTRSMFLSAVVPAIKAEAESLLKLFGYGLMGAVATAVEELRAWGRRR